MVVKELIKKLKEFEPNLLVVVGAEAIYWDIQRVVLEDNVPKYDGVDVVCIDAEK